MVGQRVDVALDAHVQQKRRRGVRARLPVVVVVLALVLGEQFALGVAVVGVDDDAVGVELLAVDRLDEEAVLPAVDLGHLGVSLVGDAHLLAQFDQRVDDGADAALRVVDAEVEVDVAHHVVQRRRVRRRPAEEHERVLHDLLELRVLEVVLDVALHRPDELEAHGRGGQHVQVDPVPQARAVLVDELVHRRLVVALAGRQILVEGLAGAGFVGLELSRISSWSPLTSRRSPSLKKMR